MCSVTRLIPTTHHLSSEDRRSQLWWGKIKFEFWNISRNGWQIPHKLIFEVRRLPAHYVNLKQISILAYKIQQNSNKTFDTIRVLQWWW